MRQAGAPRTPCTTPSRPGGGGKGEGGNGWRGGRGRGRGENWHQKKIQMPLLIFCGPRKTRCLVRPATSLQCATQRTRRRTAAIPENTTSLYRTPSSRRPWPHAQRPPLRWALASVGGGPRTNQRTSRLEWSPASQGGGASRELAYP